MKTYRITETQYYHIEGESEEDAPERFDSMTLEEKKTHIIMKRPILMGRRNSRIKEELK